MTSRSSGPQSVSPTICAIAADAIGPRHATARSGSVIIPIESARMPCARTGWMRFAFSSARVVMPSSMGTDGPWMSASISPTAKPRRASATARLAATVDLPTPPLPLATATMRRGRCGVSGPARSAVSTSRTEVTPATARNAAATRAVASRAASASKPPISSTARASPRSDESAETRARRSGGRAAARAAGSAIRRLSHDAAHLAIAPMRRI